MAELFLGHLLFDLTAPDAVLYDDWRQHRRRLLSQPITTDMNSIYVQSQTKTLCMSAS